MLGDFFRELITGDYAQVQMARLTKQYDGRRSAVLASTTMTPSAKQAALQAIDVWYSEQIEKTLREFGNL